jgi:rod shape determining protein RodA
MSKKIKTFDIILPLIPILLVVISIAVIYSLVFGSDSDLAFRQGIFALIGIAAMLTISFFDYQFFRGTSWIFYILTILLLVYVDFFGMAAGGAMRWIDLGFFQLQPSELAKIFLIISLASFYCGRIGKLKFRDIVFAAIIFLPTLGLVLKEPDLGTGLVLCFIFIILLYAAKPSKIQTIIISIGISLAILVMLLPAFNIAPFNQLMKD